MDHTGNPNKLGAQRRAMMANRAKHVRLWSAEPFTILPSSSELIAAERARGFEAGWVAAVRWVKRHGRVDGGAVPQTKFGPKAGRGRWMLS